MTIEKKRVFDLFHFRRLLYTYFACRLNQYFKNLNLNLLFMRYIVTIFEEVRIKMFQNFRTQKTERNKDTNKNVTNRKYVPRKLLYKKKVFLRSFLMLHYVMSHI